MEKIINSQSKDSIIKNIIALSKQNTINDFQPDWFLSTMDSFKDFTDKILELLNTDNLRTHLLSKTMFFDKETFNNRSFNNFFDKATNDMTIINTSNKEMIKNSIRCKVKTSMGGINWGLECIDKNNKAKSINVTICNAWKTPFDTIHTLFHELCHALQTKYKIDNDKQKGYLNLYIIETQANLFANIILLLKAIETKNTDIINRVKNEITNLSLLASYESGYFCYPIITDIINNLDNDKFYTQFLKNNELDIKSIFDYTYNKVCEKAKEYADFFADSNNFEYGYKRLTIKNTDLAYNFIKDIKNIDTLANNKQETEIEELNNFYGYLHKIKRLKNEINDWKRYIKYNNSINEINRYQKELKNYSKFINKFDNCRKQVNIQDNNLDTKLDKMVKELNKLIDKENKKYERNV